jgi:hypothetical protein
MILLGKQPTLEKFYPSKNDRRSGTGFSWIYPAGRIDRYLPDYGLTAARLAVELQVSRVKEERGNVLINEFNY